MENKKELNSIEEIFSISEVEKGSLKSVAKQGCISIQTDNKSKE
jgi:hypothetical protein